MEVSGVSKCVKSDPAADSVSLLDPLTEVIIHSPQNPAESNSSPRGGVGSPRGGVGVYPTSPGGREPGSDGFRRQGGRQGGTDGEYYAHHDNANRFANSLVNNEEGYLDNTSVDNTTGDPGYFCPRVAPVPAVVGKPSLKNG